MVKRKRDNLGFNKYNADILVTDSYQINGGYLREINNKVKLLVSIDDLVQPHPTQRPTAVADERF